jgi:hypothetical protein
MLDLHCEHLRHETRAAHLGILHKFRKLAYTRIAHEYIQAPECRDSPHDKLLSCLKSGYIPGDTEEPSFI